MSGYLKDKFLRICPYGKQYLNRLVLNCIWHMIFFAIMALVIIFFWNSMFETFSWLYVSESVLLAFYLVCMEVPNHQVQTREDKIYRELLIYFSRVKHRYMACRHMANSVMDAAEGMSYEIQRLADEIYRVLLESDRKEKVREYILYHKTNRYLKLFLIQAYEVSEKGDMFFAENIEHLRLELMEEIYRRKRRSYEFAGYIFVTVAPFFLMPVLKYWGIGFTSELQVFYAGIGALLETITFVVTIIIYGMILGAKEIVFFTGEAEKNLWNTETIYKNKTVSALVQYFEQREGKISNGIRQLLLQAGAQKSYGSVCFQMLILAMTSFLIVTGFFAETHKKERQVIMNSVASIETIVPVAGEEKQALVARHILEMTEQCLEMQGLSEESVRILMREKIRLGNASMEQAAIKEVLKKVEQYKNARWSLWELIICCLTSGFVSLLPLLKLYYQAQAITAGAVYEVRQFQSVILMERKLQGITVMGLLEDMEIFSQCFRKCLRKCINSYGAGPKAALLRLKEEGSHLHEGFEELSDAFLSVDEVGIELAFAEVESNRRLLEKMTQLEAEINMERKKDNTELISKLPMLLTVGAYFVLPFFSYSLQGVFEVFELLEEMQR